MSRISEITRPPRNIVDQLESLPSATVHEVLGKKGALDSRIKPIDKEMKICGPAMTVRCHVGDNLTLHYAISKAKEGDVLVVDAGGYEEEGLWGEITTMAALQRGINGLVIDGGVRDTERIVELGFPVFSRSVSIKGTVKETLGDINTSINCGGTLVNPGDAILGDRDGVVVIPKDKIDEVYEKGQNKEKKEKEIIEEIAKGKLTIDLLGFRDIIEGKLGED